MQSLKLKLRKRKYKLSLSRGGGDREGPTAFKNAGSEWEFENFSPWIFSAKPCNTKEEDEEDEEDEEGERVVHPQDDEDVKYWGPRPKVQGLVHPIVPNPLPPPPSHPPPPPPPAAAAAAIVSPATTPRYGILSYFPRRPSSWSPTSTAPPPIPPHAWQIRRRATARASRTETNGRTESSPPPPLPPPKNRPISASHTDLKRSASCYQEPRDAASRVSDSLSDLRSPTVQVNNGSSSWGTRAANRLKRVQSELSNDSQQLLLRRPRTSAYIKLEPTYIAPYRCRSTNEVRPLRPLRKQSASLRHNGLMSTLASSESHLSGSYTLLSDDIDRPSPPALPPPPLPPLPPPSPPSHRSSPPPPPVPPHAPGVLCTRITAPSAAPVYAVVLRNRPGS